MKLLWFLLLGYNLAIMSIEARYVGRIWEEDSTTTKKFESCDISDQRIGLCIPLTLCEYMLDILTKTPLNDPERAYLKSNQCGFKDSVVFICCPFTNNSINTTNAEQPKPPESAGSLLPSPGVCGAFMRIRNRVLGGTIAGIEEYPWMAALIYKNNNAIIGIGCSGFLINNYYVLTAAHCVHPQHLSFDLTVSHVRLGDWDIASEQDCDRDVCSDPPINVAIDSFIIHGGYARKSYGIQNDIALLKLRSPVAYTDWIKPLCLPMESHLRRDSFQGKTMASAGWGVKDDGFPSRFLRKVQVPVILFAECFETYKNLKPTQMCAGGKGVDTCIGDSGGPLIDTSASEVAGMYFYAAGIVSFGDTNCGSGQPAVYTRIIAYMDWILRNIKE